MRILFLPLAATSPGIPGVLTRALARELASRVGLTPDVQASFLPFAHMVEGRRVFGVYGKRCSKEDLGRLATRDPAPEFLVHGDLESVEPFRITLEVLRAPDIESVEELEFEDPEHGGFDALEAAARFVLETVGAESDSPVLGEFPAQTFEGYMHLLTGREAAAGLDAWGDPTDPAAVFDPYFAALKAEPGMKAAREELCLVAASSALGGVVPLNASERAVRKVIEIDHGSWRAWAALAQVLLAADDRPGAVEAFEKALEIDPRRATLRYDLGMTYLREGRVSRAAKALATVKTDPQLGAEALLQLGAIRADKDDLDGAIEHWRASLAADPERAVVYAHLGGALASRGEFDEAEQLFERGLDARVTSWTLHLALGCHLAEQDRFAEAEVQLKTVLRLKPGQPEAHLHLGRRHVMDGNRVLARHHLRKALAGPEKVRKKARLLLDEVGSTEHEDRLLAELAEAIERPAEEQEVVLKSLLKVEPGFAEARVWFGLALIATGHARAGEKQFRKVLKAHPDDPEAWSGLATALRCRKKLEAAEEAHRQAIECAPNHAPYHMNLADTLLRQDLPHDAAQAVDAARALDPRHPLLPVFTKAIKFKLSEQLPEGEKGEKE